MANYTHGMAGSSGNVTAIYNSNNIKVDTAEKKIQVKLVKIIIKLSGRLCFVWVYFYVCIFVYKSKSILWYLRTIVWWCCSGRISSSSNIKKKILFTTLSLSIFMSSHVSCCTVVAVIQNKTSTWHGVKLNSTKKYQKNKTETETARQ